MLRKIIVLAAVAAIAVPISAVPSDAGGASKYRSKSGPQVRGYAARKGGYSYNANDVANTGRDSRTQFGSVNTFRDPFTDRQTIAGPFDHGWFFDSGVAPRGGDSPYLN